jgi:hypothetical protein
MKAHMGMYLVNQIRNCLCDFEVQNKVRSSPAITCSANKLINTLALTLDNAANNNTLVEELGETLEGYQGLLMHVGCFAHILNLVIKAILSEFNKQKASSNDDDSNDDIDDDVDNNDVEEAEDDGDEVDPVVEASDVAMIMEVIEELDGMEVDDEEEFGECRRLTDEELNMGQFALSWTRTTALGAAVTSHHS